MRRIAFERPKLPASLGGSTIRPRPPLGEPDATPRLQSRLRSRVPVRTLSSSTSLRARDVRDRTSSGQDRRHGGRQPDYFGPPVLEAGETGPAATAASTVQENVRELPAEAFYQILHDAQPDQVRQALLSPQFADLVASVPSAVFVEALNILSPDYFVEPYRRIHRALHPRVVDIQEFKPLALIFAEFRDDLIDIIAARRRDGRSIGVAEYTHLLSCSRAMGDEEFAVAIWSDMEENQVAPDAQCYNHRMGTVVWDKCFVGLEKYRLRVTHYNYRKRRFGNSLGWMGYGTGPRSTRGTVWKYFQAMLLSGHTADEDSFINLFLASARVGHVRAMKHILKTAWNVDVDALLQNDDESGIEPVTPYDRSSPMYPSTGLLFAVVHGFGTNSMIPAALRAVEYISRSYEITIAHSTWLELFERAFQLSRPRHGPDASKDLRGSISVQLLRNLFDIMIAAPHNLRPTIDVYRTLAKTAWDGKNLSQYRDWMNAAYDQLREARQRERRARHVVKRHLANLPATEHEQHRASAALAQSPEFLDAVNSYDIERTNTFKHSVIMHKLVRLLVIQSYWTGRDNATWPCQLFPDALAEWGDFLPETFVFWTGTGKLGFHGHTHWHDAHFTRDRRIPLRRDLSGNPLFADEVEYDGCPGDDTLFWERFMQKYPGVDRNLAPFKRLQWTPRSAGDDEIGAGRSMPVDAPG